MLSLLAQTRAEDAAVGAIVSPLLEFPIDQAAGVIFNIVGGLDMSLTEASLSAVLDLGAFVFLIRVSSLSPSCCNRRRRQWEGV